MLTAELTLILSFLTLFNHGFGQNMLGLNQGEICKGSGSTAWKCEILKSCPQVGDFRRNRPTICSFQGIDPIVCCPPAPAQPVTNLPVSNGMAAKKCFNFIQKTCLIVRLHGGLSGTLLGNERETRLGEERETQIGEERESRLAEEMEAPSGEEKETRLGVEVETVTEGENKVFGGRNAKSREYRHMVLVGYGSADAKSWDCGGSLISEKWVLSAAHCSAPKGQGPARWARVGDLDISSTTDDARPQEKMIVQRIVHPSYKEPAVYNDIALFRLDSDVLLNDWVAPICLHTENEIPSAKATVTGWGRLDFVGDVSAQLQEVDISLVSGTECKRLYDSSRDSKIPQGINPDIMVCAGEKEGGKDACSGDSGGPLVIQRQGQCLKTQVGITSFGRDCGLPNTPGVYTKVSYFVPWIESIVWPNAV